MHFILKNLCFILIACHNVYRFVASSFFSSAFYCLLIFYFTIFFYGRTKIKDTHIDDGGTKNVENCAAILQH